MTPTPIRVGQIWLAGTHDIRWTVVKLTKRTELHYQVDLSYQSTRGTSDGSYGWSGSIRFINGVWARGNGVDPYALATLIYDPA
jgi:hypothetical protein